ncbi:MAG TPA: class I SAM-dependent methyltransferase [Gaiellaceae bacterium]|jgi:hypothetical protein|nr:class I SAM-dependent methyltransferase [Gaiellaceae bacterium]
MIAARPRVTDAWLRLREPADAAARDLELVEHLRRRPPASGCHVIHDLGSGTGSMGRWLAPLLPGPQRWILHDQDEELLESAATERLAAADGASVVVETRRSDVTLLDAHDLSGASLITASALLDLLTRDELEGMISAWAKVGCPVFLSLSVVGRVELAPADPLDRNLAAAFDAHQRRMTPRGRLLGPDAVDVAVEGSRRRGAEVVERPTPWRLGAAEADLAIEWLAGWIGAACEEAVELAAVARSYGARRLSEARSGELAVTVHHADVLVLP